MSIPRILHVGLWVALSVVSTQAAQAQGWEWPEDPENLQVLPEDITPERLSAIMRGFSGALGVRCHHCHDDSEGRRFTEMDFASDAKPEKEKARLMMRMVQAINEEYLAELEVPADERVGVTCVTCHRGLPRPVMLENVLVDLIPSHGVDSTIARYRALRTQYYGGFSYDFSEPTLLEVSETLVEEGNLDEALQMLALNLEMYPESWRTHMAIGEAYLLKDDPEKAREHFMEAQEMNPENLTIQRRLDELDG